MTRAKCRPGVIRAGLDDDDAVSEAMVMPAPKQHKPQRAEGVLIKWEPARGFGFVRRDHFAFVRHDHNVGNVFVSSKAVRHSGIDEDDLQVGMRLSFSLHPDPDPSRAPWATNIEIQR
jgi:cold shock CspA family protein